MSSSLLTIGTRGSPLALAQAHLTQRLLAETLGEPATAFPLDVIKTTGDRILDRPLSEAGGKGLFTKEIDEAQLAGSVRIAVHSGKDLPTVLPDGLALAGFLPREDVRDVFIGREGRRLVDIPHGATIGTASLRRQAQLRRLRPDLSVIVFRGNVNTRLAKLAAGDVEGTMLALAGLNRLGLSHHATEILDTDRFLPACAQGAIALVVRADDRRAREAASRIVCPATTIAVTCERAYLAVLDGSCRTPIAGHATLQDDGLTFRGEVLKPDGTEAVTVATAGPATDAAAVGEAAGHDLASRLPRGFLSA